MAYDPSKPLTGYNTPLTAGMRQDISTRLQNSMSKDPDKNPAAAKAYLARIGYTNLRRPTFSGSLKRAKKDPTYQQALQQYNQQRRGMMETVAKNIPIEKQRALAARIEAKQKWWAKRQASR